MTFDHEAYERCFHSNDHAASDSAGLHVDAQTSETAIDEKAVEPVIETAGDPAGADDPDIEMEGGETDGT